LKSRTPKGLNPEPGLTPQRKAVLRAIQGTDHHPTASEVFAAAQALLPSISFATVYNSLRYLKEASLSPGD